MFWFLVCCGGMRGTNDRLLFRLTYIVSGLGSELEGHNSKAAPHR
jgi:hypothetical protein